MLAAAVAGLEAPVYRAPCHPGPGRLSCERAVIEIFIKERDRGKLYLFPPAFDFCRPVFLPISLSNQVLLQANCFKDFFDFFFFKGDGGCGGE